MASTKRVSGNYNIIANTTTIHGNLVVIGQQANISTADSQILDNTIILNAGEVGNGVTAGTSGIEISRGGVPNAFWQFNETGTYWSGSINGELLKIKAANPVANTDVMTLGYLLSTGGGFSVGNDRSIQFNDNSHFGSSPTFNYFANGNVQNGNTFISNAGVLSTSSGDLVLDSAAKIYFKDTLKLQFQTGSTPTNVASTVQVVANTPGTGGSGLFVVNANGSDELINKRKALWLALAMR